MKSVTLESIMGRSDTSYHYLRGDIDEVTIEMLLGLLNKAKNKKKKKEENKESSPIYKLCRRRLYSEFSRI